MNGLLVLMFVHRFKKPEPELFPYPVSRLSSTTMEYVTVSRGGILI